MTRVQLGSRPIFARPLPAAGTYIPAGTVIVNGGQIYTAPAAFTRGSTFDLTKWVIGAVPSYIIELNALDQNVADWVGNGLGTPATSFRTILNSGIFNLRGPYDAAVAYDPDDAVIRTTATGQLSFVNLSSCTGIDPITDVDATTGLGTHWWRLASSGPKGDKGDTGSATTDLAVQLRHLEVLARRLAFPGTLDVDAKGQNYSRADAVSVITTSTRVILSGGPILLAGGEPISQLKLFSSSAAIALALHQFVLFYDFRTNALLAAGADVTNQAWPANTAQNFPIAYTPTVTREVRPAYYIEVNTTGGAVPNLAGKGSSTPATVDPRLGGLHDTLPAGSGPGAAPATLGAATGSKGPFWCEWK